MDQILTSGRHLLTLIDQILEVSNAKSENLAFLATNETQSAVQAAAR